MLEKRILEKVVSVLSPNDTVAAKAMIERSGIVFTFGNGASGRYVKGMMQPIGTDTLVDFNAEGITGILLSPEGKLQGDLAVDQSDLVQSLQNKVAELDGTIGAQALELENNAKIITALEEEVGFEKSDPE